jgi:hypothetical protein
MSFDDDWPDQTVENRRKRIRETIRPATLEELRELGARQFPVVTDPWCEKYNAFLKEHADERFYRAESPEGAIVLYCRDSEKGIWFLPGQGTGIVQPRGLDILREIVDAM